MGVFDGKGFLDAFASGFADEEEETRQSRRVAAPTAGRRSLSPLAGKSKGCACGGKRRVSALPGSKR